MDWGKATGVIARPTQQATSQAAAGPRVVRSLTELLQAVSDIATTPVEVTPANGYVGEDRVRGAASEIVVQGAIEVSETIELPSELWGVTFRCLGASRLLIPSSGLDAVFRQSCQLLRLVNLNILSRGGSDEYVQTVILEGDPADAGGLALHKTFEVIGGHYDVMRTAGIGVTPTNFCFGSFDQCLITGSRMAGGHLAGGNGSPLLETPPSGDFRDLSNSLIHGNPEMCSISTSGGDNIISGNLFPYAGTSLARTVNTFGGTGGNVITSNVGATISAHGTDSTGNNL